MKHSMLLTSTVSALLVLIACLAMADSTTNRYVVKDNPHAEAPYDTWTNAAPDIQTAIDVAIAANGDNVIVAPGIYDSGATWDGDNSNRVSLVTWRNRVTVRSRDNDPATTIIKGAWDPASTNGLQAVRCVSMASGAQLIGFTLTNGATRSVTNVVDSGGGVLGNGGIVSNCVITGNSAYRGAGVYNVHLYNCLVENNLAYQGGGAYFGSRYNCIIRGNQALYGSSNQTGGGLRSGFAYNCLIEDNQSVAGGGAREVALYNCTIVNNIGSRKSSGTYNCTFYNCISWNNVDDTSTTTAHYSRGDGDPYLINHCTQADPLFVDAVNGNWRQWGRSPCVDTGTNQPWMVTARDLDGRRRLNGVSDMGCYEYWSPGTVLTVQ